MSGKFPEYLDSFHSVRKLSKGFEKISDNLFQIILKFSKVSQNFPKHLERFQSVNKFSRQIKNLPECLETFRLSINFSEYPQTFQGVWKLSRVSGNFFSVSERFSDFVKSFHTIPDIFKFHRLCGKIYWPFQLYQIFWQFFQIIFVVFKVSAKFVRPFLFSRLCGNFAKFYLSNIFFWNWQPFAAIFGCFLKNLPVESFPGS